MKGSLPSIGGRLFSVERRPALMKRRFDLIERKPTLIKRRLALIKGWVALN
jgi:hypothetical protein